MKPHIKDQEVVDYYECTDCGWAYPFPRMTKPDEVGLPNKAMAMREFDKHDCDKFPPPKQKTASL